MFCDRCGTRVQDHDRACLACSRRFPDEAGVRLTRRLERLGLLWCAMSNLQIATAAVCCRYATVATDQYGFSGATIQIVAVLLAIFGLAAFAVGIGLHGRESWARPLALMLALPAVLEFPVGTALGIYTVRTLIPRRARAEYRSSSAIWT